ncbi:peptidase S45 penicillin amidase [Xylanimonas cellulosilytica DSM 15894]|uniref:Peptidase S45 penicillin amidase n=1 Tax=Xylanimonas cellulosilytica (strain DSM 15894 / JCM 12276 / CECT 5975 / KCTC 9989 / LMG 20990 / NBRC 107835 / XIL07) TaxID=446471 RepID=D1BYF6_XYLCX|nr:peptidase S45 penicillin amidase [Xylanimonas cellulosilytica DSM 15894]
MTEAPPEQPSPAPRRRRSRLRRLVVGVAVVVVLVLVAATAFTAVVIRRPLPQTTGTLQLDGLTGDVRVLRDERGVPQIFADTPEDLFRAQGFVAAQDRFFEMDYRRHVTAGRLAELVGDVPEAIEADKVIRTFGWRRVAEQEWDLITPQTRAFLTAYADGVNAYLATRAPEELAVEYTVLGLSVDVGTPEPWDPIDSLAWLKAMAWDLRGNYDDELERALAYSELKDVTRVEELFPPFATAGNATILAPEDLPADQDATATPTAATTTFRSTPALDAALASARDAIDAVPVLVGRGEGTGSNSWVVSGEHTASGAPMLANDPHLSLGAPSIWAQVGLHCNDVSAACPFSVAGFSFAGFPGVIIGHNGDLAWGLTNMGADVTDFFIERLREDTVQRGEEWVPVETRTETIRVSGSAAIDLEVRTTTHGPIISDVLDVATVTGAPTAQGTLLGSYAVALAWTALTPGYTADAVFAINLAQDADDIREAAALFDVPAQNIVFATVDGHIGYQAPGRIPLRAEVTDSPVSANGAWPRDGRDPRYDWQGWVPAEEMPRALDPASGFIVAANQAVLPDGVGPHLTSDWDYGFRSERIRTLLQQQIDSGRPFTADDFNTIQNDDWSPFAQVLLPALLDVRIEDEYDAAGQRLLRDWDGRMTADSAAAAYFSAVWRNLLQDTFWDDLPPDMRPDGGSKWLVVLRGMLEQSDDRFWDDRSTLNVTESRDEALLQAMVSARRDMTVEMSKNPADWRWGTLHHLRLQHSVLGGESIPAPVRRLMNPSPIGMPGSSSVVNATAWDAGTGSFDVTAGPSMRMVVDLGHIDASTWVNVTGSSGHPGSRHYTDQLRAWAEGRTFPFPFTRDAVEAAARDELTLRP